MAAAQRFRADIVPVLRVPAVPRGHVVDGADAPIDRADAAVPAAALVDADEFARPAAELSDRTGVVVVLRDAGQPCEQPVADSGGCRPAAVAAQSDGNGIV